MRAIQSRQIRVLIANRRIRFSSTLAQEDLKVHENGRLRTAQEASTTKNMDRLSADRINLASLLRSHGKSKALSDGRVAHARIVSCGYDHDIVISNCLVQMYGSCGTVKDAQAVFDRSRHPNVYSWNILINVYTQNGILDGARGIFDGMACRDAVTWNSMIAACVRYRNGKEAMCLFRCMQSDGIACNNITFVSALDACTGDGDVEEGQEIHIAIICVGFEEDVIVGNALINFYGKHGCVHEAQSVFCQMPHRDIISWTAMLSAFGQNGDGQEALDAFYLMQLNGMKPDKISHICALDACASLAAYEDGQVIHSAIVEGMSEQDIIVSTALINVYGKCESVQDANNVFARMPLRNVISWTAMLAALLRNMRGKEALDLFYKMQIEGINPNHFTFSFAVDACTSLLSVADGQEIHAAIVIRGLEHDVAIATSLVNLYGKCRFVNDARSVFSGMLHRDVITWSTMIAVCTRNGLGQEALGLFHQMEGEGVKPNNVTFLCLVDACSSLAALEEGRAVDVSITACGLGKDVMLGNALMNMYGKCGSLHDAEMVFSRMAFRNVISWTSMIAAFAQCGHGRDAVVLFHEMLSQGIKPDSIAFTCILTACSHSGLVEDGRQFFCAMIKNCGIPQTMDHFVCMIDLLGRAGHLDEAESLIRHIPFQKLAVPWLCLLGACRSHGDVERGSHAANCCFELEPQSSTPYTMLGNVFATGDKLEDVAILQIFPEEKWCGGGDWLH